MNPRHRNNTEISKHNRKRKMPLDLGPRNAVLASTYVRDGWLGKQKGACLNDDDGGCREMDAIRPKRFFSRSISQRCDGNKIEDGVTGLT